MISNVLRCCRRLQNPIAVHLFNQSVAYRIFHSTSQYQIKSNHQDPGGNSWNVNWWNKFWKSWAPVPTIFGLTILIVWQYSRKLQHRYLNDEVCRASQLQIQCYRTIPLRFLSRSWGKISHIQIPTPLRKLCYVSFSKTYGINLDEIRDDITSYASLGEFFIRHLKHDARPIAPVDMVSPADGTVLNCGRVTSCYVEQVKGTNYLIKSFLGENTWDPPSQGTLSSQVLEISETKNVNYLSSSMLNQKISCNEYIITTVLKHIDEELERLKEDDVIRTNDLKIKYKTENTQTFEEVPVVPKIIDFYVKDILQTFYSGLSMLLFKNTPPMDIFASQYNTLSEGTTFSSQSVASSDPPAPVCTPCSPSAEQEWLDYKRHLLQNPDNELYQIIIYLAPGDYHRFHSPTETNIKMRRHFQGDLLSVNPCIACWIPDLFVLNERAAYMGSWKHGFFSMVMVGATNVGSIKVHCDETLLTNCKKWNKGVRHKDLSLDVDWNKGDEVGEFRMGSTIVLLFEAPKSFEFNIKNGDKVKVGQSLVL